MFLGLSVNEFRENDYYAYNSRLLTILHQCTTPIKITLINI